MPAGRPCEAPPGRDAKYCFWHDPDKADDVAEAQRLGGIRRKRERTLAAAYDFTGLGTVAAIARLLEIASIDALALDSSIARCRVLISAGEPRQLPDGLDAVCLDHVDTHLVAWDEVGAHVLHPTSCRRPRSRSAGGD